MQRSNIVDAPAKTRPDAKSSTDQAPVDAPRVLFFPPLLPMATMALSGLLQRLHPLGLFGRIDLLWRAFIGGALVAAGIGLMVSGNLSLIRNGTSVHTSRPTLKLVGTGVYHWTRNPLYLGGSILMLGCAFLFTLDWLPLALLPTLAVLHFGVILPEETYLELKFGEQYRRYKATVPRYLGPL